jgi:hypothetical protein
MTQWRLHGVIENAFEYSVLAPQPAVEVSLDTNAESREGGPTRFTISFED